MIVFKLSNGTCTIRDEEADCNDGIQNGDETGVDCGGSCEPCLVIDCNTSSINRHYGTFYNDCIICDYDYIINYTNGTSDIGDGTGIIVYCEQSVGSGLDNCDVSGATWAFTCSATLEGCATNVWVEHLTFSSTLGNLPPICGEVSPGKKDTLSQLISDCTFSIYPNVSSGIFYIDINPDCKYNLSIYIYNSQGSLIEVKDMNHLTKLDLSNFNSGIYFIQPIFGNQILYGAKLVKI